MEPDGQVRDEETQSLKAGASNNNDGANQQRKPWKSTCAVVVATLVVTAVVGGVAYQAKQNRQSKTTNGVWRTRMWNYVTTKD